MPEVAEIFGYAKLINTTFGQRVFSQDASDPRASSFLNYSSFKISSVSRGKELLLTIKNANNESDSISIRFNFGLVGKFVVGSRHTLPTSCRLYFASRDEDQALCLVDTMKGASWEIGTWSKDRGPCPLTEYQQFKDNVLNHLAARDFDEEIGIALLNQKFFNGIGNYLRAEILFKAQVNPFQKAREVFSNPAQLNSLLQLCHAIPQEVVDLGLNKYGSPEDVKKFENWLRCYGKASSLKDKKGRTMWYDPKFAKNSNSNSVQTPGLASFVNRIRGAAQPTPTENTDKFKPEIQKFSRTDNVTAKLLFMVSLLYNDVKLLPIKERDSLKYLIIASKDHPDWLIAALQAFEVTQDFSDVVETLKIGLSLSSESKTSSVSETQVTFLTQHLHESSWVDVLNEEFSKPYFGKIAGFLKDQKNKNIEVFPPEHEIFQAFNLTPLDRVKVVLLGQDPYHDNGQAHGLAFSVKRGVKPPPSLVNMYRELETDITGFKSPSHGNLEDWARQGVFLLNATLTVQAHSPNSHSNCGWQQFTDSVIRTLSAKRSGIVFLLLGKFAQDKGRLIDKSKHTIIQAAHPSPLSASKWFGSHVFSQVNDALEKSGHSPIDWRISD